MATATIISKIAAGDRIGFDEALTLYEKADFHELGRLAHAVRLRKHPEPVVSYVVDRNINYSNVCICGCRFCAFYRPPAHAEAYVLTREQLTAKIEETLQLGGTQILLQGGHHPDLPLSFYEEMLRFIKDRFSIHIHAFSPPEIVHFAKLDRTGVPAVIARLIAAGLDSIPGGGAEILVDSVRQRVSPNKCTAAEWLEVMEEAHHQGLRTTSTMICWRCAPCRIAPAGIQPLSRGLFNLRTLCSHGVRKPPLLIYGSWHSHASFSIISTISRPRG